MQPLPHAREEDAVRMLVAAFDEDPYFRFLFPDDDDRARFVGSVMRQQICIGRPVRRAVLDGDEVRGVNVWWGPSERPSPLSVVRHRGSEIARLLARDPHRAPMVPEILRMLALMIEAHPPRPYAYLELLAVGPTSQGRGIGGGMLRALVERADRDRVPAALETSKPSNVGLYERFGFRVTRTLSVQGSPPVWSMLRPAASEPSGS